MSFKINQILTKKGWLLADGATGTNLFNLGLEAGEPPEFWNEEHPDRVTKLYQGSVDAGSDLFLTNSFGSNRARLKLHNAQDRAFELSKKAAEIARNVADKATRDVIVAGSVGPTGDIMGDAGWLSHEDAVEIFHEQAEGLVAGGVDVLWLETISSTEEFLAAAEAFEKTGTPWAGTMSFDTAGRTMMGLTAHGLVELVNSMAHPPIAFGANCGVGASDLLRTVSGFREAGATIPIIAKGNAGIPKFHDGHIHYDGTPELMADYAVLARDCGAQIIGGCCGTMPEHLRCMRKALETTDKKAPPTLDEIKEKLGAFSSEDDGNTPGADKPRRKRRARSKG